MIDGLMDCWCFFLVFILFFSSMLAIHLLVDVSFTPRAPFLFFFTSPISSPASSLGRTLPFPLFLSRPPPARRSQSCSLALPLSTYLIYMPARLSSQTTAFLSHPVPLKVPFLLALFVSPSVVCSPTGRWPLLASMASQLDLELSLPAAADQSMQLLTRLL